MNSLNWQTGHRVSVPKEWLPKPYVPKPLTPVEASVETDEGGEPVGEVRRRGPKKKKPSAKQRAYERMLLDLQRQEEAMEREKERMLRQSEMDAAARKEAERLARLAVIEERERRQKERELAKLERQGAALKKRRDADDRVKKYKTDKEAAMALEIETKTKHRFEVRGNLRPDGRVRNKTVKPLNYMYYGDFAAVGKEKDDELKQKWGRFADPDLYFWVPHGYGEFRDHSAEEPFMEGEMVSGVMSGIGAYRFKENGIEYKGLFQNDRPQGFGMDTRPSGDPDHPIAHRLAVYQRGKQICFLDELTAGARIKLYGTEHGEYLTDGRNAGTSSKRSTLPVMPHAKAPHTTAVIVEAVGAPGVFRVKPDGAPSLVVNLRSMLWDLEAPYKPLFQGLELITGEVDEERFTFDPILRGGQSQCLESDHRENWFGSSSRVKLEANLEVEKQAVANRLHAEHKAREVEKVAAEAEQKRLKDDRKEARRMLKSDQKQARADAAVGEAIQQSLGAQYGQKMALRQQALEASRLGSSSGGSGGAGGGGSYVVDGEDSDDSGSDDGLGGKKVKIRKPYKPNSGSLIFDDQRWTFIQNGVSLPGPPKADEDAKKKRRKAASRGKMK